MKLSLKKILLENISENFEKYISILARNMGLKDAYALHPQTTIKPEHEHEIQKVHEIINKMWMDVLSDEEKRQIIPSKIGHRKMTDDLFRKHPEYEKARQEVFRYVYGMKN